MTGYPGDEHVFSVVVIVLARSPDCNPSGLVILCVPAALLQCVVCDLFVCSTFRVLVGCEVSSAYSCQVCEFCAHSPTRFKQQLTRLRRSWKADGDFSQVVSELRWKVPKESTLQVVTGVGTRVDEQFEEERTRSFPT